MPALPRIETSPDGHFLVAGGQPFFWLGDTAWELFHRLTRDEAAHYFSRRQQQRFTVIMAVALAEFDGLGTPNANGDLPLLDGDPARPNEAYFGFVDELIGMAAARGLYVGLLPTWGDKVTPMWGTGPAVFTPDTARGYGEWLGRRYRDQTNLIWVLGGDRPPVHGDADYRPVWRAMAEGIRAGTGGAALITYHPPGGNVSTSTWLQDEPWLDIHMIQSGHGSGHDVPVWQSIARDYALLPPRPTLDGEPNYEDHPVNPWPSWDPASGYFRDHDVRKQAYRSVLAGGCGITYGHHAVWQFAALGREIINHADRFWRDALERPGAAQMQHLRTLVESRPYPRRVPGGVLAGEAGQGGGYRQAARDADGRYALVYLPTAEPVTVAPGALTGDRIKAWWYDPRTGAATAIGELARKAEMVFTPPENGPDWVLVLDDANAGFGRPGLAAA